MCRNMKRPNLFLKGIDVTNRHQYLGTPLPSESTVGALIIFCCLGGWINLSFFHLFFFWKGHDLKKTPIHVTKWFISQFDSLLGPWATQAFSHQPQAIDRSLLTKSPKIQGHCMFCRIIAAAQQDIQDLQFAKFPPWADQSDDEWFRRNYRQLKALNHKVSKPFITFSWSEMGSVSQCFAYVGGCGKCPPENCPWLRTPENPTKSVEANKIPLSKPHQFGSGPAVTVHNPRVL